MILRVTNVFFRYLLTLNLKFAEPLLQYEHLNYGRKRSSGRESRLSLKAKETSRLAYGSDGEYDANLPVKKRRIKEELVSEVNMSDRKSELPATHARIRLILGGKDDNLTTCQINSFRMRGLPCPTSMTTK